MKKGNRNGNKLRRHAGRQGRQDFGKADTPPNKGKQEGRQAGRQSERQAGRQAGRQGRQDLGKADKPSKKRNRNGNKLGDKLVRARETRPWEGGHRRETMILFLDSETPVDICMIQLYMHVMATANDNVLKSQFE